MSTASSSSSSYSSSHASQLVLPLPKTYRAAIVEKGGAPFTIKELPTPTPKGGEVLVQVLGCGLCHSDSFAKNGMPWASYPRCPGHELAGIVAAVGPDAKRFKVGDYVGRGWHGDHCFSCDACLHGHFVNCSLFAITGLNREGGYAEYNLSPWQALAKIPDGIPPSEAGPLLCAGVTVFNSMRNQRLFPGSLVAVQGIGGLGHLAIQFAVAMGFRVVALSTSDKKKKLAEQLGAHVYLDSSKQNVVEELNKLGGAALIVSTAFDSKAQAELQPALGRDGTLLLLGVGHDPLPVNTGLIVGKRAKVAGFPSGSPIDSEETCNFADFKKVKTHVELFTLDNVQAAYDRMMSGEVKFRAVIEPWKKA